MFFRVKRGPWKDLWNAEDLLKDLFMLICCRQLHHKPSFALQEEAEQRKAEAEKVRAEAEVGTASMVSCGDLKKVLKTGSNPKAFG